MCFTNSLAPGRCDSDFKKYNSNSLYIWLWHWLWNCSQVNATEHHKWELNIDIAHVLVTSGNSPSTELMSTHIGVAIWGHQKTMSWQLNSHRVTWILKNDRSFLFTEPSYLGPNRALNKSAWQYSTWANTAYAHLANDGNNAANFYSGSCSLTNGNVGS